MSSSMNMVKSGKVMGTGALKKVVLGFKPKHVVVFNATALISGEKMEAMSAFFAKKAVAAGTTTFANQMIQLEADGFSLGTDALNGAGEELYYTAFEAKNE